MAFSNLLNTRYMIKRGLTADDIISIASKTYFRKVTQKDFSSYFLRIKNGTEVYWKTFNNAITTLGQKSLLVYMPSNNTEKLRTEPIDCYILLDISNAITTGNIKFKCDKTTIKFVNTSADPYYEVGSYHVTLTVNCYNEEVFLLDIDFPLCNTIYTEDFYKPIVDNNQVLITNSTMYDTLKNNMNEGKTCVISTMNNYIMNTWNNFYYDNNFKGCIFNKGASTASSVSPNENIYFYIEVLKKEGNTWTVNLGYNDNFGKRETKLDLTLNSDNVTLTLNGDWLSGISNIKLTNISSGYSILCWIIKNNSLKETLNNVNTLIYRDKEDKTEYISCIDSECDFLEYTFLKHSNIPRKNALTDITYRDGVPHYYCAKSGFFFEIGNKIIMKYEDSTKGYTTSELATWDTSNNLYKVTNGEAYIKFSEDDTKNKGLYGASVMNNYKYQYNSCSLYPFNINNHTILSEGLTVTQNFKVYLPRIFSPNAYFNTKSYTKYVSDYSETRMYASHPKNVNRNCLYLQIEIVLRNVDANLDFGEIPPFDTTVKYDDVRYANIEFCKDGEEYKLTCYYKNRQGLNPWSVEFQCSSVIMDNNKISFTLSNSDKITLSGGYLRSETNETLPPNAYYMDCNGKRALPYTVIASSFISSIDGYPNTITGYDDFVTELERSYLRKRMVTNRDETYDMIFRGFAQKKVKGNTTLDRFDGNEMWLILRDLMGDGYFGYLSCENGILSFNCLIKFVIGNPVGSSKWIHWTYDNGKKTLSVVINNGYNDNDSWQDIDGIVFRLSESTDNLYTDMIFNKDMTFSPQSEIDATSSDSNFLNKIENEKRLALYYGQIGRTCNRVLLLNRITDTIPISNFLNDPLHLKCAFYTSNNTYLYVNVTNVNSLRTSVLECKAKIGSFFSKFDYEVTIQITFSGNNVWITDYKDFSIIATLIKFMIIDEVNISDAVNPSDMRQIIYRDASGYNNMYIDQLAISNGKDVIDGFSNSNVPRGVDPNKSNFVYKIPTSYNMVYKRNGDVTYIVQKKESSTITINENITHLNGKLKYNKKEIATVGNQIRYTNSLFYTALRLFNVKTIADDIVIGKDSQGIVCFGDILCTVRTFGHYVSSCSDDEIPISRTIKSHNGSERVLHLHRYNRAFKYVDTLSNAQLLERMTTFKDLAGLLIQLELTNVEAVNENTVYFDTDAGYNIVFYMDILIDIAKSEVTFIYKKDDETTVSSTISVDDDTITITINSETITLYRNDDTTGYLKYVRYDNAYIPPNTKYTLGKDVTDFKGTKPFSDTDLVLAYTVKTIYLPVPPIQSSITMWTNRCWTEYRDDNLNHVTQLISNCFSEITGYRMPDGTIKDSYNGTKDVFVAYTDEERVYVECYDKNGLTLYDQDLKPLERVCKLSTVKSFDCNRSFTYFNVYNMWYNKLNGPVTIYCVYCGTLKSGV